MQVSPWLLPMLAVPPAQADDSNADAQAEQAVLALPAMLRAGAAVVRSVDGKEERQYDRPWLMYAGTAFAHVMIPGQ